MESFELEPDFPDAVSPPLPPPPKECIVCQDLALYDDAPLFEGPPRLAAPGSIRCAEHAGVCRGCYKLGITSDRKDFCTSCAENQFLCIVCTSMHLACGYGDPVHQPKAVGQKRCFRHQGWCAACMKFSVESDAEDVCAKCKRDGYRPAYTVKDIDFGELQRDKCLCWHASATPCHSPGQWDHLCACSCYWCNNRYGWDPMSAAGPRTLPAPPTAEQDMRDALLEKLSWMSTEERWSLLTNLLKEVPSAPG